MNDNFNKNMAIILFGVALTAIVIFGFYFLMSSKESCEEKVVTGFNNCVEEPEPYCVYTFEDDSVSFEKKGYPVGSLVEVCRSKK